MRIVRRDRRQGTIVVECPGCKMHRRVDAASTKRARAGVTVILTCPGCGTRRALPGDLVPGQTL